MQKFYIRAMQMREKRGKRGSGLSEERERERRV
jgi:hypothetical protein